jgi:hypothetical protein
MNTTEVLSDTNNLVIFDRSRNNDKYKVMIWLNDAHVINISQNIYYLEPDGSDSTYSFSCQFLNNPEDGRIQDFGETETASRESWEKSGLQLEIQISGKSKELRVNSLLLI